jgi:hypothetical protein
VFLDITAGTLKLARWFGHAKLKWADDPVFLDGYIDGRLGWNARV